MKHILLALLLATAATGAQASDWFGGGDNGEWKMGPNGPYWDESDWPEWTPMYWMEEFMDNWDDNDNNWGGNGFGFGNNYGSPYGGGYGAAPYGYGAPAAPYGAAPYGYAAPTAPYAYPTVPQVPR